MHNRVKLLFFILFLNYCFFISLNDASRLQKSTPIFIRRVVNYYKILKYYYIDFEFGLKAKGERILKKLHTFLLDIYKVA